MAVPDENRPDWLEPELEELHGRLRRLQWPRASEEARSRCWEEIVRHMADQPKRGVDDSTRSARVSRR